VRDIMFAPTAAAIEAYLKEVNAGAASLLPMAAPMTTPGAPPSVASSASSASAPLAVASTAPRSPTDPAPYSNASANNVTDAYNALKTYIMLSDRHRVEASHMSDQVTRFWRGWLEANRGAMPREQMLRHAERLISFTVLQSEWSDFPQLEANVSLVEQTRENLRRVVKGMAARERVYAEIRARASTRFPPLTVARIVGEQDKAIVVGSYAISGAYTRAAWQGYVADAIKEAAYKELQTEDWVLKTSARDDLSLEGSPEQIQKGLVAMYKTDYIREWQRFMQGISVQEFAGFSQAVEHMNRLGDSSQSPLGKIVQTLYEETSWDSNALVSGLWTRTKTGVVDWFKRTVRGGSSAEVNVDLTAVSGGVSMGPVAREFAPLSRLTMSRDNAPTLMKTYLESLSKVRSRFNQIKAQGDPGPASQQFAQQTLDGAGSELADTLKLVDEQMLNGMNDNIRATFRPFLVRPLQQAFQVLVPPAEAEINRVWTAKVLEPYQRDLSSKYPFSRDARVEAGAAEIGRIFGAEGAIAKFATEGLGTLVTRRGDVLTARTWGDVGIRLRPDFTEGFRSWVQPLEAQGAGGADGAAGGSAEGKTAFQVLPQPTSGLTEYTIEIDGQVLRYRNTSASWVDFVWPSSQGKPGVRISGITFDGRAVEFANFPGRFGLEKMINSAQRRKLDGGVFEFRWTSGSLTVPVHLRIISAPGGTASTGSGTGSGPRGTASLRGLVLPTLVVGPPNNAPAGNTSTSTPPANSAPAAPARP
jgi:type VI secretion system protein ImpL